MVQKIELEWTCVPADFFAPEQISTAAGNVRFGGNKIIFELPSATDPVPVAAIKD